MLNIVLISLLMVQIIQFSVKKIMNKYINKKELIISLYLGVPFITLMLYVKLGFSKEFIMYFILMYFLIVISIVDYYTMYIYDITIISGIIIQGIIIFSVKDIIINHILGLGFGIIVPYIILKVTKGIGSGDIGVYALCCFCIGIEKSIHMIPISFIIGGIYAIYLLTIKKANKSLHIPFAPCIFLATTFILV